MGKKNRNIHEITEASNQRSYECVDYSCRCCCTSV